MLFSPISFNVGALAGLPVVPVVPPADWRMPATVTLNGAANAPLNTAQLTAAAKTRPGIAVAASGDTVITYQVGAHDTDGLLSFHSARMAGQTIAIHTSADGVTGWASLGFTKLFPSIDTPASRRQAKLVPYGAAKFIRLTVTGDGTADTIYPLLHKMPASGPADTHMIVGASRETELIGTISSGFFQLEAAIVAAYPTRDPLIFNWAVFGATPNLLVPTVLSAGIPGLAPFVDNAYIGNFGGNNITANRIFDESERPSWEGWYNDMADGFIAAGIRPAFANHSYRAYTTAPVITPTSHTGGSLEYNNLLIHQRIAAKTPLFYNTAEDRPYIDEYQAVFFDRANLEDQQHGSPTGDANMRAHKVQYLFRFIYEQTWPTSLTEQKVAAFEVTPNQANYNEAFWGMNSLAAGAPKTAWQARIDAATTAPTSSSTPTLSDTTPTVGDTLDATAATWAGVPTPVITYEWRDASGVVATSATMPITSGETGKTLKRREIATNSKGSAFVETAFSSPVAAGGGGGDVNAETAALVVRLSSAPDSTFRTKIDNLFTVFKAIGVTRFFGGKMMANNADGRLDWFDGNFNWANINSMVFANGTGFTGADTRNLESEFTKDEIWASQNSGSMFIGLASLGTGVNGNAVGANAAGTDVYIQTATGQVRFLGANTASYTWSVGNFILTRNNSANFTIKKNAAAPTTITSASTAIQAATMTINKAVTFGTGQIYTHWGASAVALTPTQENDLAAAIATFLAP